MDGQTDGQTDGWMNSQMNRQRMQTLHVPLLGALKMGQAFMSARFDNVLGLFARLEYPSGPITVLFP